MLTTDHCECTWDLYKTIPSLRHEGRVEAARQSAAVPTAQLLAWVRQHAGWGRTSTSP